MNKKTLTFYKSATIIYTEDVINMKDYINNVIRPKIQGDGGEIIFVSQYENIVNVAVRGECSKCLILDRCTHWIEEQIKNDLDQTVTVIAERQKPFFWDK